MNWFSTEASKVNCDDICSFTGHQCADLIINTQHSCTVQSRHTNSLMSIDSACVLSDSLCHEGGCAGFLNHIKVVVARGTVGSNGDVDAALEADGSMIGDKPLLEEAVRLIHEGCITKAMKLLEGSGLGDLDLPAIRAQLERKHPQQRK